MSDLRSEFETLHTSYHPMVLQMCMGFMKGDKDLAADLSQDVFINVWNSLPNFRSESSHKTWIYRIAVNTCLSHIRKSKNKIRVPIHHHLAGRIICVVFKIIQHDIAINKRNCPESGFVFVGALCYKAVAHAEYCCELFGKLD